jgi:hypothetical protein
MRNPRACPPPHVNVGQYWLRVPLVTCWRFWRSLGEWLFLAHVVDFLILQHFRHFDFEFILNYERI